MKLNIRRFTPYLLPLAVALMLLLVGDVLAEDPSDGQNSLALSTGLYCDTKNLLEGSVGKLLGLIMVIMGIASMVKGGSFKSAFVLILIGATITAIPGFIQTELNDFAKLLNAAGITSVSSLTFPANCTSLPLKYDTPPKDSTTNNPAEWDGSAYDF